MQPGLVGFFFSPKATATAIVDVVVKRIPKLVVVAAVALCNEIMKSVHSLKKG